MVSNLFFFEMERLLPCPTGEDGALEIYLFGSPAAKIFPVGKRHKKIPMEKSKNHRDFMEVVTF